MINKSSSGMRLIAACSFVLMAGWGIYLLLPAQRPIPIVVDAEIPQSKSVNPAQRKFVEPNENPTEASNPGTPAGDNSPMRIFLETVALLPIGEASKAEMLDLTTNFGSQYPRIAILNSVELKDALPLFGWLNLLYNAGNSLGKAHDMTLIPELCGSVKETHNVLNAYLGAVPTKFQEEVFETILTDTRISQKDLLKVNRFIEYCGKYPGQLKTVFLNVPKGTERDIAVKSIVETAFDGNKLGSISILDQFPESDIPAAQEAFFDNYIKYDMNAALGWVSKIEDPDAKDRFLQGVISQIAKVDLQAAYHWAGTIRSPVIRKERIEMLDRRKARFSK